MNVMAQVLPEPEYNMLMRIKDLKGQYKDQFAELQVRNCSTFGAHAHQGAELVQRTFHS